MSFSAMSLQKNQPFIQTLIVTTIAIIVLGAFSMSIAAFMENLRFVKANNQILWLVSMVRSIAAQQKGFGQNQGEDIWGDLIGAGQIDPSFSHANPWRGEVRAITVANMAMRIENDLPTHDCSRIALYFLGHQPSELGLMQIEGQAVGDNTWLPIYPLSSGIGARHAAEIACGRGTYARLALIFRVR